MTEAGHWRCLEAKGRAYSHAEGHRRRFAVAGGLPACGPILAWGAAADDGEVFHPGMAGSRGGQSVDGSIAGRVFGPRGSPGSADRFCGSGRSRAADCVADLDNLQARHTVS